MILVRIIIAKCHFTQRCVYIWILSAHLLLWKQNSLEVHSMYIILHIQNTPNVSHNTEARLKFISLPNQEVGEGMGSYEQEL